MRKNIIGLTIIGVIFTSGIIGCRNTALNNTQRNLQRVGYQTQTAPNDNTNTGMNNRILHGKGSIRQDDNRLFDWNQGIDISQRNNTGTNQFGRVGYKNTNNGLIVSGNRITFPSGTSFVQNNTTFVEITPYITRSTVAEQNEARRINKSKVKNNNPGSYNSVPMFTLNLPKSKSYIGYDDINANVIYVKDTSRSDFNIPISLQDRERIVTNNDGRTYMPISTLRKILSTKTGTNAGNITVDVQK